MSTRIEIKGIKKNLHNVSELKEGTAFSTEELGAFYIKMSEGRILRLCDMTIHSVEIAPKLALNIFNRMKIELNN